MIEVEHISKTYRVAKRIVDRNVPPQPGALPEHNPDMTHMLLPLLPRHPAVDPAAALIRRWSTFQRPTGSHGATPV